jgi:probable rRNA maturation factor
MAILFHTDDVQVHISQKNAIKGWIKEQILRHNLTCGDINIIFCSDERLLEVNKQYLNHDYYTDIITFDYTVENQVSGDLFISSDRIQENAMNNCISTDYEFFRIIIHGVLHLAGYKDKTPKHKVEMTQQEDISLSSELIQKITKEGPVFHVEQII